MWIHWNKATNLFHAEEVSRILSFPAPRLNDLVRIDMKDYALCYQFPSSPTGFQNFALWPLFQCLSIPNIVGVIEAAISQMRRIIFVSHHPSMLTMAAETVRFCVRVYEWSGLYKPIVHASQVHHLVQDPGPYILGVTAECRGLFTAPADALLVELDKNFVITSDPPNALSSGQRNKMIDRLSAALSGEVQTHGVPSHLKSAYGGGKLIPAGQIIVMKGEVESIQDPDWWNQDAVMSVMDHVCDKMNRNTGIKKLFSGSQKKPLMTKVSVRHLHEVARERNQYSRDAHEAWQDFINLKARMDTELTKVSKRNNFLVEELESWKQQFLKFQAFAEGLTKETQDLKIKIENYKRENRRLTSSLDQANDEKTRLSTRLSGTEKQRDDALEALVLQQEIAEELERERKKNKNALTEMQKAETTLLRERDEANRVVLHLRALIEGQAHHMEHIVKSLHTAPELSHMLEAVDENGNVARGTMGSIRSAIGLGRGPPQSGRSSTPMDASPLGHQRSGGSQDKVAKLQMTDVADRYLRERTDSITYIIQNISQQCAQAVEGLHLAQRADRDSKLTEASTAAETADDESTRSQRNSVPPTPDLINHRASTLSTTTEGTIPRENSVTHETKEMNPKIAGEQVEPVKVADEDTAQTDGTIDKSPVNQTFHDARAAAYGSA